MKNVFNRLTVACIAMASMPANAIVDCAGEVTLLSLQLANTGAITLSLVGGPYATYLCDLDGTRNGVSPVICRSMYSALIAAKAANKKVLIRFYDHSDCAAIPPYTNSGTLGWTMLLQD